MDQLWLTGIVLLASCGGNSQKDGETKVKYKTLVMKSESRVYNLYIPAALQSGR